MTLELYESNHRSKENFELVEIAFFHKKKYEKNAILSAKKIIQERNLSTEEVDALKQLIRTRLKQERREHLKEVKEEKGYWGWVIEFILDVFLHI